MDPLPGVDEAAVDEDIRQHYTMEGKEPVYEAYPAGTPKRAVRGGSRCWQQGTGRRRVVERKARVQIIVWAQGSSDGQHTRASSSAVGRWNRAGRLTSEPPSWPPCHG